MKRVEEARHRDASRRACIGGIVGHRRTVSVVGVRRATAPGEVKRRGPGGVGAGLGVGGFGLPEQVEADSFEQEAEGGGGQVGEVAAVGVAEAGGNRDEQASARPQDALQGVHGVEEMLVRQDASAGPNRPLMLDEGTV